MGLIAYWEAYRVVISPWFSVVGFKSNVSSILIFWLFTVQHMISFLSLYVRLVLCLSMRLLLN